MEAPSHLSPAEAAAWCEIAPRWGGRDPLEVEAAAVQVARMRDARRRIEQEGEMVMDARDRPVQHPAIAIERAAQAELRRWFAASAVKSDGWGS